MSRLRVTLLVASALLRPAAAEGGCTLSTTPVGFGTYDVFAATPLDSTGSVTWNCDSNEKDLQITLTRGGSSTFNRRMIRSGGSDTLDYNLYLDASRSTIWGDGTGGTGVYFEDNSPPLKGDIVVTIYARAPAGQDVPGGTYTDLVTAIINF